MDRRSEIGKLGHGPYTAEPKPSNRRSLSDSVTNVSSLPLGFSVVLDWRPGRLVMAHPDGRQVDLHPTLGPAPRTLIVCRFGRGPRYRGSFR
jgi:hypothetical protein